MGATVVSKKLNHAQVHAIPLYSLFILFFLCLFADNVAAKTDEGWKLPNCRLWSTFTRLRLQEMLCFCFPVCTAHSRTNQTCQHGTLPKSAAPMCPSGVKTWGKKKWLGLFRQAFQLIGSFIFFFSWIATFTGKRKLCRVSPARWETTVVFRRTSTSQTQRRRLTKLLPVESRAKTRSNTLSIKNSWFCHSWRRNVYNAPFWRVARCLNG